MPWYEVYGRDEEFEKYYEHKPHLYKRHEKYFKECNDEYLELANSFHPSDYEEWLKSLGKLYKYEKELYAKVDRYKHLIIVSYYDIDNANTYYNYINNCYCKYNTLYMRFIYDTKTTAMYHYRMKRFRYVTHVLNRCDGSYQMGGWTDFDKFYTQYQKSLDDKSIEVLKSIEQFKYLPIELFKKISVYNLFQVNEDTIYQYEILLKNGLVKLATDMLLDKAFITPDNFKRYKKTIMGGIRLKDLRWLIHCDEQKEQERIRKLEKKEKIERFAKLLKREFDLGDYILRHPKDVKELEHEGRELQHCVATYLDRIISKDTDVMFLRKKSEPDKPFFTVEIQNKRIVQVRTFKNQTDPDITEIVERRIKEAQI